MLIYLVIHRISLWCLVHIDKRMSLGCWCTLHHSDTEPSHIHPHQIHTALLDKSLKIVELNFKLKIRRICLITCDGWVDCHYLFKSRVLLKLISRLFTGKNFNPVIQQAMVLCLLKEKTSNVLSFQISLNCWIMLHQLKIFRSTIGKKTPW